MEKDSKKIVLPKELQIRMLNFFMRTSIPKKIKVMREKQNSDESTIKK